MSNTTRRIINATQPGTIMTQQTATTRQTTDDPNYAPFLRAVAARFAEQASVTKALFTVETVGLWDVYLSAFPEDQRQTYNCSACRQFVQRIGGVVRVDDNGERVSLCWDPEGLAEPFAQVAERMRQAVIRQPIAGAFVASAGTLGLPQTGAWSHLATSLPSALGHRDRLQTPGQRAAAIRENVATVARALDEFSPIALGEALRVLEADALSRSEKFIGPVRWLLDLHTRRDASKDERRRSALLWHAVATAPEGYSHPRASVIGPLLEGIAAGKSFETLRSEFAAMLHPLRYQRPQSAPSAGNIANAERVVAQLGLAPALERRFARLDECETIWTPKGAQPTAPAGGVFSHLTPKQPIDDATPLSLPIQTMTWDKFVRTVLPNAERIALRVPSVGPFIALTTATNADAPPIIRWDRDERRNSVSWYVYHNGSSASQWGLQVGAWCDVTGVVPLPNLWGDRPAPQHSEGVVVVLKGAADQRGGASLALFPEHLRDDLHQIRSTIEAFSRNGSLTGLESASACGYDLRKSNALDCHLRVTVAGRSTDYRIDRWD